MINNRISSNISASSIDFADAGNRNSNVNNNNGSRNISPAMHIIPARQEIEMVNLTDDLFDAVITPKEIENLMLNYLETERKMNTKNITALEDELERLQGMYTQFLIPARGDADRLKFAANFLTDPDQWKPTDEMITSPTYDLYIQEHLEEFEEFMGMNLEDYNLCVQAISESILFYEANDYTLRQAIKCVPYDVIMLGDEYQNYVSNLSSNFQTLRVPNEYLNQEQINMYNYLYNTKGKNSALDYLEAIEDSINQVRGQKEAAAFLQSIANEDGSYDLNFETFFKTSSKGVITGIENFGEGFENLFDFSGDGVKTENQYAQMCILQALYESGQLDDKFLAGTFEVSTSIGNMIPAAVVSMIVNKAINGAKVGDKTYGEIISNTLMGLSAAGNAKNAALISGNPKVRAYIYGLLSGTSEALIGEAIGNIPGLNDAAKFSLKGILSEGGEEYIQEYVDAGLRSLVLGESIDITELNEQAKKSFFYGCISSFVMTGGVATVNFMINGTKYTVNNANELINLYNMHMDSKTNINEINTDYLDENDTGDLSNDLGSSISNNMDTKVNSLEKISNFNIELTENGMILDVDGKDIGVTYDDKVTREILAQYEYDVNYVKTFSKTVCKYIQLDSGKKYVLLVGGLGSGGLQSFQEKSLVINELARRGVNIPKLVSRFYYDGIRFEIQELVEGASIFSADDLISKFQRFRYCLSQLNQLFELDQEVYFKFVDDIDQICASGLVIDANISNFILDFKNQRINLIDFGYCASSTRPSKQIIVSFFNRLNVRISTYYKFYTSFSLDDYLPPISDCVEKFSGIKSKLIDSYVKLLLKQGYDNDYIETVRFDLEKELKISIQSGKPFEKIQEDKSYYNRNLYFAKDSFLELISDFLNAKEIEHPTLDDVITIINDEDLSLSIDDLGRIDVTGDDIVISENNGGFKISFTEEFLKKTDEKIYQLIVNKFNAELAEIMQDIGQVMSYESSRRVNS